MNLIALSKEFQTGEKHVAPQSSVLIGNPHFSKGIRALDCMWRIQAFTNNPDTFGKSQTELPAWKSNSLLTLLILNPWIWLMKAATLKRMSLVMFFKWRAINIWEWMASWNKTRHSCITFYAIKKSVTHPFWWKISHRNNVLEANRMSKAVCAN